jgi:hypothetical protein
MHASRISSALLSLVVMSVLALVPSGCSSDEGSFTAPGTGLPASGNATLPPDMPTGLEVVKATDHGFKLGWQPCNDADLAGYRIYVYDPSPYRANSYVCVHDPDLLGVADAHYLYTADLSHGPHYFKVAAVDTDGNESARYGPIEFTYAGPNDDRDAVIEGGSENTPACPQAGEDEDPWSSGRDEYGPNGDLQH